LRLFDEWLVEVYFLLALILILLAKWVHRDISAGNIILVKTAKGEVIGKLSDLEYAQELVAHQLAIKIPRW